MSAAIDRAMVLAAGLGTRMRPASGDLPKPLVRVARRPLLDHVLDRLDEAGVARAVVNVHYRADQIERHLAARTAAGRAPAITISDERGRLLDTGGGICKALPLLGDGPFIAHNSDVIWLENETSNLARLMAAWDDLTMDCLLLLVLGAAAAGYDGRGDFVLEADGRLRRRRDGDVAPFVYTGVQIVHPRAFAATPEGPFSVNLVWNHAILAGRAYGVRLDGLWMHVGAPDALAAAERLIGTRHLGTGSGQASGG